ncbi:hypothetical protein ASD55_03340 [Rhodanobacter sp. Root561]|uniref:hypothetical protein n=1 Tax=Rhodanobacter sp. Root561 TaxID=1736560 RepID=UPI0006FB08E9|nr:hypothetical protein [Rhodanobacter sp. Root561]KQZ79735.1 hypothetical protein ASD55_03340 [Rhodanobacter sp. Root561]
MTMTRSLLRATPVAVFLLLACSAAIAREPVAGGWRDTRQGRMQAQRMLQTLNADLLGHDSATLTLERWCAAHRMASPARVVAHRVRGVDKPLPPELRAQLMAGADQRVKYRRVQLACGDHVLSEADNWYLPDRLTAAMNHQLDTSDVPFGKVVRPLHFRRKTLSARVLWSVSAAAGTQAIPHAILQHRALLYDAGNRPFSALIETYTDQVLAFPPRAATPEVTPRFEGAASDLQRIAEPSTETFSR